MARFFSHDGAHYQYEQAAAAGQTYNWLQIREASEDPDNAVAIYKLTQSLTYKDPFRMRFRDEAHAAGFKYILFYHWLSSVTKPTDQAHHMLATLEADEPLVEHEGFMLDDEEGGVTISKTLEWKYETLRNIKRSAVAVYTGAYVAGIWQSTDVFDDATLGVLAAYTSEAKMLALPGVHNHLPDIWQYSSNGKMPNGTQIPGITGRGDCNDHYQENNVKRKLDVICGIVTPVPNPLPPIINTGERLTPQENLDMADTVVTHSEPRIDPSTGIERPAGWVKYILVDGFKKHINGAYHAGLGSPEGNPLTNQQLDEIEDYPAPTQGGGGNTVVNAPTHFVGTVDLNAQTIDLQAT